MEARQFLLALYGVEGVGVEEAELIAAIAQKTYFEMQVKEKTGEPYIKAARLIIEKLLEANINVRVALSTAQKSKLAAYETTIEAAERAGFQCSLVLQVTEKP
jgi:ribosomal protein S13